MTLLAIAHIEGEASLSCVARKLGTTKQSVNQILKNLEKRNCVEIKSSLNDKRKVKITLTFIGETLMQEYYKIGTAVFLKKRNLITPRVNFLTKETAALKFII